MVSNSLEIAARSLSNNSTLLKQAAQKLEAQNIVIDRLSQDVDMWQQLYANSREHAKSSEHIDLIDKIDALQEALARHASVVQSPIAAKKSPLSPQQIEDIFEVLPGGVGGFLKGWGWMQFARSIEHAHGIS